MLRVAALGTLLSLVIAACAAPAGPPPATTETGEKSTCDELVFPAQSDGIRLVDRVLVPYTKRVLGVEAEYQDDQERTLTLISGGFLDDITEPYDDLALEGTVQLADATADVLVGSFFGSQITIAYRLGNDPPCSTLAAVAVGFSTEEFAEFARGMTMLKHGTG